MVPRPNTSFFMAFRRAIESSRPISNRKNTMPNSPVAVEKSKDITYWCCKLSVTNPHQKQKRVRASAMQCAPSISMVWTSCIQCKQDGPGTKK